VGPNRAKPWARTKHNRRTQVNCWRGDSRIYGTSEPALDRLKEHAEALGANAVVSVEFDSSEIGQTMTELLAYGTAVVVEKDETPSNPVRLS
jgi:hypothetical protein